MVVKRIVCFIFVVVALLGVTGCYQMHSDDDLRSVPITNNPNVVPQTEGVRRLMAMP